MQYWKSTDENGFIITSTLNVAGEGNITEAEYNEILRMYIRASKGYGVIETSKGFEYAPFLVQENEDIDSSEAINIILGGEEA